MTIHFTQKTLDYEGHEILDQKPHRNRGWVFLFQEFHGAICVCWKADRRSGWAEIIRLPFHDDDWFLSTEVEMARDHFRDVVQGGCDDQLPPPKTGRKNRKRDTQKERVYSWETDLFPFTYRKMFDGYQEAYEYTERVCADLGIPMIEKFEVNGKGSCSYFRAAERKIKILTHMLTPKTVLHEIAHYYVWYVLAGRSLDKDDRVPSHGKEFVGVAMALYEAYMGLERMTLTITANQRNLKYRTWTLADLAQEPERRVA